MYKKIRAKRDARLYFMFSECGLSLGEIKSELIKLGYIEHVEGDRFLMLKKFDRLKILDMLTEIKNSGGNIK